MNHGARIAKAIKEQAKTTSELVSMRGTTKLGIVADVSPLAIIPMGGAIALPEEALIWSNLALNVKNDLAEGDTVLLSMVDGDTYVVHDVMDTGTLIDLGGGGGGPSAEVTFLSVAKWGVD